MNSDLVPSLPPEEELLATKKAELASLEDQLAERELELATLRAELDRIEHAYLRSVGVKYAELDRIEAEIAELLAAENPDDTEMAEKANDARERARESAQATEGASGATNGALQRFTPSDALKSLYRAAAKKLHPDLADNEDDRALRTRLMAEVNQAYAAGDEDRIRQILREWEMSPESVKGDGVGADLVRILRKIRQVENRLRAIIEILQALKSSQAYRLKEKLEEASAEGRNLFEELANHVDLDIDSARLKLRALHSAR